MKSRRMIRFADHETFGGFYMIFGGIAALIEPKALATRQQISHGMACRGLTLSLRDNIRRDFIARMDTPRHSLCLREAEGELLI